MAPNTINPNSIHSERTTQLLLDFAALCENDTTISSQWLAERKLSLDELHALLGQVTIAVKGYALSSKPVQTAVLLIATQHKNITSAGQLDQASIESILMKRLAESALARAAASIRASSATKDGG